MAKIKISTISKNPDNPRFIRDEKFEKLVKSVLCFPKMMKIRPIVVDETNTALGGNMRIEAIAFIGNEGKEKIETRLATYGFADNIGEFLPLFDGFVPGGWVKKITELTDEQKSEFVIKDNVGFGEWDWNEIANNWDADDILEWGLDTPDTWEEDETDYSEKNQEIDTDEFSDKMTLKLEFLDSEYAFVIDALAKQDVSKELALLKLLGYDEDKT